MNIQTNIQKIKYLRLLTDSLKGGWVFTKTADCPCGHLAQIVTGLTGSDFAYKLRGTNRPILIDPEYNSGTWAASCRVCPTTGKPLVEVVEDLLSAGFTLNEIIELEQAALNSIPESPKPNYIFDFISSWRSRLICETENYLSECGAELQVEKLLSELIKEKELV